MIFRWIALVLVAQALGGCGTSAVLGQGSKTTIESDESLIVLGVNPGYRVLLFPGDIVDGKFKQGVLASAVINGASTDGYIVARARAGQVLGLTSVTAQNQGLMGRTYTACGGARLPVFHVPKGQLVYLSNIRYEPNAGKLSIRYDDRLEEAAAFLRLNYPQFKGQLQPVKVEAIPAAGGCGGGTIYIPIYVGR